MGNWTTCNMNFKGSHSNLFDSVTASRCNHVGNGQWPSSPCSWVIIVKSKKGIKSACRFFTFKVSSIMICFLTTFPSVAVTSSPRKYVDHLLFVYSVYYLLVTFNSKDPHSFNDIKYQNAPIMR